jgi:hypothetical protein
VRKTTIIGFAITGALAILGSLLLERNEDTEVKMTEEIPELHKSFEKNKQLPAVRELSEPALTLQQALTD